MSDPVSNDAGIVADQDPLGDKLKQVALGVLDELIATPGEIDQRIDAIKAIGNLHLGLRRVGDKVSSTEEDSGKPTFGAMREKVRQAGEGK